MSDIVKVETTVKITVKIKGGDYNLTEAEAIELRDALNKAFPAFRPNITFPEGVRSPDEDKPRNRPRTPRPTGPPITPITPFNPNDFPFPDPWKVPNDYVWPSTTPAVPTWQPRIFCENASELIKSIKNGIDGLTAPQP